MSYEKTNWASGDVITAEKLNKIEEELAKQDGSVKYIKIVSLSGGGRQVVSNATWLDLISGNVYSIFIFEEMGILYPQSVLFIQDEDDMSKIKSAKVYFSEDDLNVSLAEDENGGIMIQLS